MPRDDEWTIERIRNYFRSGVRVLENLAMVCGDAIAAAARLMEETFERKGKVLICGNGGSAADSQHLASELMNRLSADFRRPPLPAVALTTDTSFITAYANDMDFSGVFEQQVLALGAPGDLLIAISTSGDSKNILRAVDAARKRRMRVLALTGEGGTLKRLTDVAIAVPSRTTQHIQEAHLAVEHVLCDLVEQRLFNIERCRPSQTDIQA
jgi:D-sedoheptulose 7-phosphate isomerase